MKYSFLMKFELSMYVLVNFHFDANIHHIDWSLPSFGVRLSVRLSHAGSIVSKELNLS